MFKRIISFFLFFAIAFSFLAVPTYAGNFSGAGASRSDFYSFANFPGGGGAFCDGAGGSREDYNTYVSTLDSTVVTFADTGFNPGFHWADYEAGTLSTAFSACFDITSYQSGNPFSVALMEKSFPSNSFNSRICSDVFQVSSSGDYQVDFSYYYLSPGISSYSDFFLEVLLNGSWTRLSAVSASFSDSTDMVNGFSYKVRSGSYSFKLDSSRSYRLCYTFYAMRSSVYLGVDVSYSVSATVRSESQTVVPASTRPASLMQTINNYNTTNNTTNYYIGTTDANGSVNQVYDPNLFNEQTMAFTEPVSGIQYQCVGWKYYYDDRVYILELADNSMSYNGTDIKYLGLMYGDDAVHIEGYSSETTLENLDFVFSDEYAYVIAEATAPEACQHVYTSETITAPTCTGQGVRRYTCELCGYTRDEKIPATGHTWEATETVETELNENGDVTKLGYTVYTCSACGETYKQYDGTGQPGPPGGSGTDSGEDSPGWLSKLFDKLQDIFSPNIDIEVDVSGGETAETQESWFTKLIFKFSWLTSVHDIYRQLAADVVSDASTAAAVSDGTVLLADVTTGHAAAADDSTQAATYTAPELAISFGSSDKYGVDWENIKAIDLSWYAPYKETVDGILSGILWLSYLFLLIKRAPGIIRGSEMVTEDSIKIENWRSKHGT